MEAGGHFSAALVLNPTWDEAHYCLGLCLANQPGKRADAIQQFTEAVRLNPTNSAWRATLQNAVGNH